MSGWLVDAVTLEHFGSVDRLSHLVQFLEGSEPPYWVEQVRNEVLAGMREERCRVVLACTELRTPAAVPAELVSQVFRVQIALGGGGATGEDHLGEAESLVMAEHLDCGVVTDDNSAYDVIDKRLGSARVADTIDVLRLLVHRRELQPGEAKLLVEAIRNNGRHLRRVHPATLTEGYFL